MNSCDFSHKITQYIQEDIPFFFLIDFEKEKPVVIPLEACDSEGIYFSFSDERNFPISEEIHLKSQPISFEKYKKAFSVVNHSIHHGDSFLVNLTYPTPIETTSSLLDIYNQSKALFKLYYKDQFVVFSPECFIRIRNNVISTYPMKGTIMANVSQAKERLLNNKKEQWEHNTIVDLMRNDLSIVAENVYVKRFRYISEIETHKGKMLQTSSEICGDLPEIWPLHFGQMLLSMLPAGSISGAPKKQTVKIIKKAEPNKRGYYTGVFGVYKQGQVDSAVAIRYIEKNEHEQMIYRSGGGITFMSKAKEEYQELINKIYVPTR